MTEQQINCYLSVLDNDLFAQQRANRKKELLQKIETAASLEDIKTVMKLMVEQSP